MKQKKRRTRRIRLAKWANTHSLSNRAVFWINEFDWYAFDTLTHTHSAASTKHLGSFSLLIIQRRDCLVWKYHCRTDTQTQHTHTVFSKLAWRERKPKNRFVEEMWSLCVFVCRKNTFTKVEDSSWSQWHQIHNTHTAQQTFSGHLYGV